MLTVDNLPLKFDNDNLNAFIVYLWNIGLAGPEKIFPRLARFQVASHESLAAGYKQSLNAIKAMLHTLEYYDILVLYTRQDGVANPFQFDELDSYTYALFFDPVECRQFRRDLESGVIKARVQQWQAELHLKEVPKLPVSPAAPQPDPLPVQPSKAQPKPQSRKGYVYLIKASTGHYKIGHTVDPENRMRTFEVKLPFKVEYEHLIACDDRIDAERRLHQKFASKRVDGEWFALTDKDVARIKKIKRIGRK